MRPLRTAAASDPRVASSVLSSASGVMGLNRLNVKDPDGVQYIKQQIAAGQQKGGGWVNFKRLNPETRKIEAKTSYCLAADGVVVFCGIYQ